MTIKERILEIISSVDRPIEKEEIADILGIKGRESRDVYKTLKSMVKENLISKDKKERYKKFESDKSFEGKVDMAEKGFAFIIVEGRDDIFVSRDDLSGAMDKDTVIVTVKEKNKNEGQRDEGYIERIIERGTKEIVGTLSIRKDDEFGFVIPDDKSINQDIFIKGKNLNGGKNNQKVFVKITKYPEGDKKPEGEIVEVLGYPGDKGIDVLAIALNHGIRMDFPGGVINEAKNIPDEILEGDLKNRKDLRDDLIFTIDGADAKDLDDAISIDINDKGNYLLGVHIADVTNYVKEGSPLDVEAEKRGTSVYLLDRVIPMLPKELSNGICSLHPNVDRLTLSVIMEIDKNGKVVSNEIVESVINSKARLVYDDVSDYLENDDNKAKETLGRDVTDSLDKMVELMEILHEKRHEKGAIDFNFVEGKIDLDEDGRVLDIYKDERRIGNRLIEEFMLITNETVSENYFWQEIPFLYRIHEHPDEEKLNTFLYFIRGLGYSIKATQNEIHPRELQGLIEDVSGKKEEAVVSRMMLRSLKKAKYSKENDIHFGLSSKYYSHFTSPIRRYPDLQIHRIIKENINGKLNPQRLDHYDRILPEVAENSSYTERVAEEAERDVEKVKKAEYMERFIGERFEGIISGITSFGIFVELENTVEGLVNYNTMEDDYYNYDESRIVAVGERTKKEYNLGDRVYVEVVHADKEKGVIDFVLVNSLEREDGEEESWWKQFSHK